VFINFLWESSSLMTWFKVCILSHLSDKKPKPFRIDGVSIVLVQSAQGDVFAFENLCPHQERPLENGHWDPANCELTCAYHKAVFCLKNHGAVKKGPAATAVPMYTTKLQPESEHTWVFVNI